MECLPTDIRAHLLSESISDPQKMAQRADKLRTICGCNVPVQALSNHQFEDVYALPQWNSSSRTGAQSSLLRSSSCRSVLKDESGTGSISVYWYHR